LGVSVKKENLIVFNIKTLAMATAVSVGVVFAMPVASQAMPVSSPVQIQTASDSNILNVKNKHVNNNNKSSNWWARHCAISNDVKCGRHYTRSYRHRNYDGPYYGQYRPYRHQNSGVTIQFD
jgi:hypothetical protein